MGRIIHDIETGTCSYIGGPPFPTNEQLQSWADMLTRERNNRSMAAIGQLRNQRVSPNKIELNLQSTLESNFPGRYEFVGDGKVSIGNRCPDFIGTNGKKEVIELFGEFWHKPCEIETTIAYYKRYGYHCVIIWQQELNDVVQLVRRIRYGGSYIPKHSLKTIQDYRNRTVKPKRKIGLNTETKMFYYME